MDDELRLTRAVFTETAGLTIHPKSQLNPTVAQLKESLEQALTGAPEGTPPQVLVFYYSGHGTAHDDQQLRIAAADSKRSGRATQLSVVELISLLIRSENESPAEIVVLLDLCNAGLAVDAFNRELARLRELGNWLPVLTVIGAVERYGDAQQLHFADSLASTLRSPPPAEQQEYIPMTVLFRELASRMGRLNGKPKPVMSPAPEGESEAFRNPWYEPPTTRRPQEEREGTGWAFCGRAEASEEIVSYLLSEAGRGGLAVTGPAGSGKSVLLDWVAAASSGKPLQPGVNAPLPPPPGCLDLLVDARNLPVASVARKLAVHYGTGTGTDVPGLVAALTARSETMRICVDSVEAARDTASLVGDLLEPLAELTQVRLVVAWDEVHPGFGGRQLALGSPEYGTTEDVSRFVRQILQHRNDSQWRHVDKQVLDDVAHAAAEAAGGSWLRAYLFAVVLSPSDPSVARVHAERSTGELFLEKLESLDIDADRQWARDLLLPVALAQGGGMPADGRLWAAVVKAGGNVDVRESELKHIQELAGEFLAAPEDDMHGAGWRFERAIYARSLAESADETDAHGAFVRAMYDRLPVRPSSSRDWSAADLYTRDYFPHHARIAGVLEEYLDDPEFLLSVNAETLRRALIIASQHWNDKADKVRSLCERIEATDRWDGYTLSRMALLAQVGSLDTLARRAAEWTSGWQPLLVQRHPSHVVFRARNGVTLTTSDSRFWRNSGTDLSTAWSEVHTPAGGALVTTTSVIELGGVPCIFAGQIDGSAWIQRLDDEGDYKAIDGLTLNCRLVACAQAGDGLLIAGTEGWQWRAERRTSPMVHRLRRRLGGAATAVWNGITMVAGMTATDVSVWRSDGHLLHTFTPPQSQALTTIAADWDGVYTGAGDGTVWRTSWDGRERRQVATHTGPVAQMKLRPGQHGRTLVSAGRGGDILLTPLDRVGAGTSSLNLGITVNSADIAAPGLVLAGTDAGVVQITL
ncbi:hypothetical protein [Streptomyces sp. NPDC006638]|uniref:hypothetical protein n=1 Tax=Streptomyces sp. NPDC006638 TaxID=3157183 RepID=UPI0033AFCC76